MSQILVLWAQSEAADGPWSREFLSPLDISVPCPESPLQDVSVVVRVAVAVS